MTVAAVFIADCESIYSVRVTYAISESAELPDVLRGKDKVTVCIVLYSVHYNELLLCCYYY